MDDSLVNIDTIINWLTEQVEQKLPIDAHLWIEIGFKINALLQNESEKLFLLEQNVAQMRKMLIEDGKTVAYAKVMVEATDEYREMKLQKAKIDRALEHVRLSKINARLSQDLMRSNL